MTKLSEDLQDAVDILAAKNGSDAGTATLRAILNRSVEKAKKLEVTLGWYANENNTIRDCMAGGTCANVQLATIAKKALGWGTK